jgi:hypothetical protein
MDKLLALMSKDPVAFANLEVAVISAIVAVVAVVVGGLWSWNAAKKQAEAAMLIGHHQIISPMRQAWINKLRERIAEFKGLLFMRQFELETQQLDRTYHLAIFQKYEEIKLLIHKGEPDHEEIVRCCEVMLHALTDTPQIDPQQLISGSKALTAIAQKVLKDEWEVTKHLEPLPIKEVKLALQGKKAWTPQRKAVDQTE